MAQPRYFPFMHGVYDVKAGIAALGKDLGNGPLDAQVFQIDDQFNHYRDAKFDALGHPHRHVLSDSFAQHTHQVIARWAGGRLDREYPGRLSESDKSNLTLDTFAMHVQEDLAVLQLDELGGNRVAYLHVCLPSGWAPEEKIGRPFDVVHAPVPHVEPISARQDSIARLMVNATRGAVRFAWTITTDSALNHHPERGRDEDQSTPLLDDRVGEPLLRVERQVIWGFPEHRAALFTIRTYLYPFDELGKLERLALASAVAGMSEASLAYKNMDRALILRRLGSL